MYTLYKCGYTAKRRRPQKIFQVGGKAKQVEHELIIIIIIIKDIYIAPFRHAPKAEVIINVATCPY